MYPLSFFFFFLVKISMWWGWNERFFVFFKFVCLDVSTVNCRLFVELLLSRLFDLLPFFTFLGVGLDAIEKHHQCLNAF